MHKIQSGEKRHPSGDRLVVAPSTRFAMRRDSLGLMLSASQSKVERSALNSRVEHCLVKSSPSRALVD